MDGSTTVLYSHPPHHGSRLVRVVSLNKLQPVLSHICDNSPVSVKQGTCTNKHVHCQNVRIGTSALFIIMIYIMYMVQRNHPPSSFGLTIANEKIHHVLCFLIITEISLVYTRPWWAHNSPLSYVDMIHEHRVDNFSLLSDKAMLTYARLLYRHLVPQLHSNINKGVWTDPL